jgi:hypothetical protein
MMNQIPCAADDSELELLIQTADLLSPHLSIETCTANTKCGQGLRIQWKKPGLAGTLVDDALENIPEAEKWKPFLKNWLQNVVSTIRNDSVEQAQPIAQSIALTPRPSAPELPHSNTPVTLFGSQMSASNDGLPGFAHAPVKALFSPAELGKDIMGIAGNESMSGKFEDFCTGWTADNPELRHLRNGLRQFEENLLEALPDLSLVPGFQSISTIWTSCIENCSDPLSLSLAIQFPIFRGTLLPELQNRPEFKTSEELRNSRCLHWKLIEDKSFAFQFDSLDRFRPDNFRAMSPIRPKKWTLDEISYTSAKRTQWHQHVAKEFSRPDRSPEAVLTEISSSLQSLSRWALFQLAYAHLHPTMVLQQCPLFPVLLISPRSTIEQYFLIQLENWMKNLPLQIAGLSTRLKQTEQANLESQFSKVTVMKGRYAQYLTDTSAIRDTACKIHVTTPPAELMQFCLMTLDHVMSLNPLLQLIFSRAIEECFSKNGPVIHLGDWVLRSHMSATLERLFVPHFDDPKRFRAIEPPAEPEGPCEPYDVHNDARLKAATLARFDANAFMKAWFTD